MSSGDRTFTIDPVSEECIACFFHGFIRNGGFFYMSDQGGMSPMYANELYIKKSARFYKKLSEDLLHIKQADIEEISFELDWSVQVEQFTHEFWQLCGCIGENVELVRNGIHMVPFRPFTHEMWLSYFIGLSWFMRTDEPNRDDKLMEFFKRVKKFMALDITNERIFELFLYFHCTPRITDFKEVAIEIIGMQVPFGYKKRPLT